MRWLNSLISPHVWGRGEKLFFELIRADTIRDYFFYPHTMSAYDKALPGWPSCDNTHIQHRTSVFQELCTGIPRDACTASNARFVLGYWGNSYSCCIGSVFEYITSYLQTLLFPVIVHDFQRDFSTTFLMCGHGTLDLAMRGIAESKEGHWEHVNE